MFKKHNISILSMNTDTGGGGAARVGSVSTLRVGSDARVGSVHCGDARVGSLKHHLNGFII